jgi:hypothetical protein
MYFARLPNAPAGRRADESAPVPGGTVTRSIQAAGHEGLAHGHVGMTPVRGGQYVRDR